MGVNNQEFKRLCHVTTYSSQFPFPLIPMHPQTTILTYLFPHFSFLSHTWHLHLLPTFPHFFPCSPRPPYTHSSPSSLFFPTRQALTELISVMGSTTTAWVFRLVAHWSNAYHQPPYTWSPKSLLLDPRCRSVIRWPTWAPQSKT